MPRPWLGVLAVVVLFAVVGFAIRWAMRASDRLSSSGRDMRDFRKW